MRSRSAERLHRLAIAAVRAACIAMAALLCALPLAAQRPDSSSRDSAIARLPTVEVVGSILVAPGPRVGSGVPTRAEVIDGSRIRAWQPRLLSDALAASAGISVYDDLGSPLKPTVVSRGFTSSPVVGLPQGISVFIDGVPVNEPDAGQVNFDLLPLDHVRSVEVLNGTASLLGPHSLGGAINLLTHRGAGPPTGEFSLSAGSHGAWSTDVSTGGSTRGISWYAGGGSSDERGWRQRTSSEQRNALANVSSVGEQGGVALQVFGATSYAQSAGSLPESIFDVAPDSNLTAGDFEDLRQLHISLFGWRELTRARASAGIWLRRHDAERFNANQEADPDVRSFSANRTIGATVDWRATRRIANALIALRVGATSSASSTTVRIVAERIDPGLTTHVESPIQQLGAFAIADWIIGRFTLSGGTRVDIIRIPFRNRLDAARDTTSTYVEASPRGGARLQLSPDASVHASIARSFRAPAVIELACADPERPCPLPFALGDDPPLDPVTATTLEMGFDWKREPLTVSASAYRTDVRDEILLFPYSGAGAPEGSTLDGYFANVPRTRRQGTELSLVLEPTASSRLRADWAWTQAEFRTGGIELFSIREEAGGRNDVEPGDRIPLVPAHTLTVATDIELPLGLSTGVDTRWVGRRYLRGDEANEEPPLSPYSTTAARLAWTTGQWELQAIVRNVFDSRHATFGTFNIHQATGTVERFMTPGEPRMLRITVRRRIGPRQSRQ